VFLLVVLEVAEVLTGGCRPRCLAERQMRPSGACLRERADGPAGGSGSRLASAGFRLTCRRASAPVLHWRCPFQETPAGPIFGSGHKPARSGCRAGVAGGCRAPGRS